MPIGVLNPKDTADSASARPAHVNTGLGLRRWFSAAGQGTRVEDQDLNAMIAQFRTAGDHWAVSDEEGDDAYLRRIIEAAVAGFAPANYVHNLSFDVAQRGLAFAIASSTNTRILDRWLARRNAAGLTILRVSGFNGSRYAIRMQRDAGNASASVLNIAQQLETAAAMSLAGRSVMVSADIRAGANFSAVAMACSVTTGTGVEETPVISSPPSFPTGSVNTQLGVAVAANDQKRVTFGPFIVPAATTEMLLRFAYTPPAVAAGANDYLDITNIQMQAGTRATPFQPRPVAQEELICRRYFERIGGSQHSLFGRGYANSASVAEVDIRYDPKRITPTITINNGSQDFEVSRQGSVVLPTTGIVASNITDRSCTLSASVGVGLTPGEGVGLKAKSLTNTGTIDVSAEF